MSVFKAAWFVLGNFIANVLYAFDVFGNAVLGGDCRETISSRVGKGQRAGKPVHSLIAPVINALFFVLRGERNHCIENINDNLPGGDKFAVSSLVDTARRRYLRQPRM